MRVSAVFSSCTALALVWSAALAADWQALVNSGGERVEIDKAHKMPKIDEYKLEVLSGRLQTPNPLVDRISGHV